MTERVARNRRKLLLLAVGWMAVAGPTVIAQVSVTPTSKPLAFDVVSIKPSPPGADPYHGGGYGVTPDGYYARINPLGITILETYFEPGYASWNRVKGAPAWVMNDKYDIVAKLDYATAEAWKGLSVLERQQKYKPMLKAMMADRFKLVVHTEPAEIQGFALVIGKHPLKLKEATADEKTPDHALQMATGGMMVPIMPDAPTKEVTYFQVSMASLTTSLSRTGGVPLVDQTGLIGKYDFELPQADQGVHGVDTQADPYTRASYWDWSAIGLELKPIKVPTVNLVIDHIERPSGN